MISSASLPTAATSAIQPGSDRAFGPLHGEVRAGEMETAERLSEPRAMLDARPLHRDAVEEGDEGRRPPGKLVQRAASAVAHRQRAGDAARGKMLHQREKIGQVLRPTRFSYSVRM